MKLNNTELLSRFNCFIKSPANKTPEDDFQFVCHHIETCSRNMTGLLFLEEKKSEYI